MMFKTATFAIAVLASMASAAVLDVYAPPIIEPSAGTVWKVGSKQNVTWDISNPPKQITNTQGKIVLAQGGQIFEDQPGGLNDPLASGFSILDGYHVVTVPLVPAGDNYEVVLFGDSGDISQDFTIEILL